MPIGFNERPDHQCIELLAQIDYGDRDSAPGGKLLKGPLALAAVRLPSPDSPGQGRQRI